MKNTLFFSYFITCIALCSDLKAHNTQETLAIEEFTCNAEFFNNILDNDSCTLPDYHPSTIRNARAIKQHESLLQKLQNMVISCYAHMLCRYHVIKKYLLQQRNQAHRSVTNS